MATLFSTLVGFIGYKIMAIKTNWCSYSAEFFSRHIITGFLMGCELYYGNTLFPVTSWFESLRYAVFGLIIYLGILFVFKEFDKQDFYFFLDIIHPKKLFSYMKSELKNKDFSNKK